MKYLAGDKERLKFFVNKKQTSQSTFVSVANIALSLTASLLFVKGWHSDSEEMFYCLLFVVYGLLDLLQWHKKLFHTNKNGVKQRTEVFALQMWKACLSDIKYSSNKDDQPLFNYFHQNRFVKTHQLNQIVWRIQKKTTGNKIYITYWNNV